MESSRIVIEVAGLHNKGGKNHSEQVPCPDSITKNEESDEVENVVARPPMEIVKEKQEVV